MYNCDNMINKEPLILENILWGAFLTCGLCGQKERVCNFKTDEDCKDWHAMLAINKFVCPYCFHAYWEDCKDYVDAEAKNAGYVSATCRKCFNTVDLTK